jgi:hypothetical protein
MEGGLRLNLNLRRCEKLVSNHAGLENRSLSETFESLAFSFTGNSVGQEAKVFKGLSDSVVNDKRYRSKVSPRNLFSWPGSGFSLDLIFSHLLRPKGYLASFWTDKHILVTGGSGFLGSFVGDTACNRTVY